MPPQFYSVEWARILSERALASIFARHEFSSGFWGRTSDFETKTLFLLLFCCLFVVFGMILSGQQIGLIHLGKQRRLAAGIPEENRFSGLEVPLANQVNHSRGGAARVDRVEQDAFVFGK